MSIKLKLFAAFTFLGLSSLLISSAWFYYFEYVQISGQQEKIRQSAFEKLSTVCREAEIGNDYIPAINFVEALKAEKYIAGARCVDGRNRIRADTHPGRIGERISEQTTVLPDQPGEINKRPHISGGNTFVEFKQRRRVGESVTVISIDYNTDYFRRDAKKQLLHVIKLILPASLIVNIPVIFTLAFFLAATLTSPIRQMERASREFGTGNFNFPLKIPDTGDEISRLAKSMADMAQKLGELDDLKQRFFNNITHDLRSPLTAVHGYTEIIASGRMGPVTSKQSESFKIILESTRRLNDYINDILDLAKLQSGSFELKTAQTAPETIIRSVADMFRAEIEGNGITFRVLTEHNLPKITADDKLIHRCVSNFVSNAYKFTPRGGTITLGVHREEPRFIRVYVEDTGPGIPKDKLEFVFDKFFQVAETKEYARKSGTGLGLTITKEIIQAHGGRVWAESVPGKGAAFIFTLPV